MKCQSVDITRLIIKNMGAIIPGTGKLHKYDTSRFFIVSRIKWTIVDALHDDMKKETNK